MLQEMYTDINLDKVNEELIVNDLAIFPKIVSSDVVYTKISGEGDNNAINTR